MEMEKKIRNANVEILRIIAMLMVITLHVSNKGMGEMTLWSGSYFLKWIMNGFCFCAVDVFFFISAYYLYGRKFRWSRIIRLWLEVVFYAVGILLICNICQIVPFNVTSLVKACVPIAFHEYGFVTGYIGMCFMAPIMTMILERLDQREHAVLIIVILFLASIYPMCTGWQVIFFQESNLFGIALLIFCIAAYVRKYGIKCVGGAKLYILCCSVTVLLGLLMALGTKILLGHALGEGMLMHYNSLTVLGAAVFLCVAFMNRREINARFARIITCISGTTFAVFLIHEHPQFRGYLWDSWRIHISGNINILTVAATVAAIFTACVLVDLVRKVIFWVLHIDSLINWIGGKMDALTELILGKLTKRYCSRE